MKTLSCTAKKINVSWCKGTWRIAVKDDIALQFSWYFEIRKQHSNVIILLCVDAPNPFDWYSNAGNLIDPLERHTNSYKQIETTWTKKKKLACIHMCSNDQTKAK